MLTPMEISRLRVFRAVAQHLNFREAAETLRLTQPAVTQQIKALESELATPLFDRAAGRVALTPAGLALLPFAQQIHHLAEDARAAVAAASGTATGQLALGASQTIAQYLLPQLVAGFLRAHPTITLALSSGNTRSVLSDLRARRIHLGLIEAPAAAPDLRVVPFLADRLVLVVPAAHPWSGREIPLAELHTVPLLSRELGSGSRGILERALTRVGLHPRDLFFPLTFDSNEALLSAVEAGLGVTFVSRWAVRNQLALRSLRLARVPGLSLRRRFSLVTLAGPEPTGAPGAFLHFTLDHAASLTPRPTSRS